MKKAKLFLLGGLCLVLGACVTTQEKNENKVAAVYNVRLGLAYLQQGSMSRAKDKILKALSQAPDWPPALDSMAYFLAKTGDHQGAEKYFQRALTLAPEKGEFHNNYGVFLCQNQRYAAGIEQFELAVNDSHYLSTAEAYENAGLCALKLSHYTDAKHYFSQALLQDPLRGKTLLELTDLSLHQNDNAAAEKYLKHYGNLNIPTPRSLWLNIQLDQRLGHKEAEAKRRDYLLKHFPQSPFAKQLQGEHQV